MRFAVFDTTTGEIVRWGNCQIANFAEQATKPGQAVVENLPGVTNETHRVDTATGQIVPKP